MVLAVCLGALAAGAPPGGTSPRAAAAQSADPQVQAAARRARSLRVSPNPIVASDTYAVRGRGWKSGRTVTVFVCEDADNDNCGQIGKRRVRRGRFTVRSRGIARGFSAVRILACYRPSCGGKVVRRVRVRR